METPLKLLAVSGSLRTASSNTMLLRAAAGLAPPGMELTFYDGLDRLPHFSPDLDGDDPPASHGHRAIADAMQFADHSTVELERLQQERAMEKKRLARS